MERCEVMAYMVTGEVRNVLCKGYIMHCPEHPTYTFVVHRVSDARWRVTEAATGRSVAGFQATRKAAVTAALNRLRDITPREIAAAVARRLLGDAE